MREDALAPGLFGASSPPVGLDIGTDHVRAAQVRPSGAGFTLVSYGSVPMPYGAVVEGEVVDPPAVSTAIRELWKRAGIRSKDVSIGVSNQKVVVRLVDLPFMDEAELAGAIQYQAQDYIPIPIEGAILSHEKIGEYVTPSDEHMMEVLLVAAQRDMISNAVAAVEGAGLRLSQVDLTAFALARALLSPDADILPEDDVGSATGLIQFTSGLTNIAIVERGVPRFTRVSALGANQFTQAVANVLNITFDEAEAIKLRVGLLSGDASETQVEGLDPETVRLAREALDREASRFIAEVRRSLDYYLTQTTQVQTIKRILLSGSGAKMEDLASYLERGLQTQVITGDPLARITASGAVEQAVLADRTGCAAAIGLAMGGVE